MWPNESEFTGGRGWRRKANLRRMCEQSILTHTLPVLTLRKSLLAVFGLSGQNTRIAVALGKHSF